MNLVVEMYCKCGTQLRGWCEAADEEVFSGADVLVIVEPHVGMCIPSRNGESVVDNNQLEANQ